MIRCRLNERSGRRSSLNYENIFVREKICGIDPKGPLSKNSPPLKRRSIWPFTIGIFWNGKSFQRKELHAQV
jgi:hypothetical protein